MEATPPKPRGGNQERQEQLTVTIPNYGKYQEPIKRGRRVWVRFDRSTPNDFKLSRVTLEARAIFYSLIMICDEGAISGITYRDLGKMLNARPQTVKSAVEQLEREGLLQTQVERKSNASRTHLERTAHGNDAFAFEQSANGATDSPLQTDITDRQTEVLSAAQPTAPAEASARKSINWDEQFQKAGEWLSETFPELATELSAYFMARVPAGSNPKQYVTSKIKAVKSQAKAMAAPREVFIAGWRAAMNKGADEAYASTVIENKVKEAFSGRQAGNQNARPLGLAAESAGSRNEPGQIWDVKL